MTRTPTQPASDYTRRLAELDRESAANRRARRGYSIDYDYAAIDKTISERPS